MLEIKSLNNKTDDHVCAKKNYSRAPKLVRIYPMKPFPPL